MIKNFLPHLIIFCLGCNLGFSQVKQTALPAGLTYPDLIGQPANAPILSTLILALEADTLYSTFYDQGGGTFEMVSPSNGLALHFTRNFTLKEIHFHDSGFRYKSFKGTLPHGISFGEKIDPFLLNHRNYSPDSSNAYRMIGTFKNQSSMAYFTGKRMDLLKLIGNSDFISAAENNNAAYWGMRILPNGVCSGGNCLGGLGTMQWQQGLTYTGTWKYGIPNGQGRLSDSSGFQYQGGFQLGFAWGQGEINVTGQYSYTGNIIMGKRVGYGEAVFADKTRYSGNWVADLMHGIGHYWYTETYHYEGQFANNLLNGQGKLYGPRGYVEGSFVNGKPHGLATQVNTPQRSTLKGNWIEGKKEGAFEAYSPVTGTVFIQFVNDQEVKKAE